MRGAAVPMGEEDVRDRLSGIRVEGRSIDEFVDSIHFPVATPADLLHEISRQTGVSRDDGKNAWSIGVAKAMKDLPFPLSKEQARERLQGIDVGGRDISQLLPKLKYPVESPASLLDQLAQNLD